MRFSKSKDQGFCGLRREIWIQFFHKTSSHHRSNNEISKLLIDGVWSHNQTKICNEVEHYYVKLYKEQSFNRPLLNGMKFDKISNLKKSMLEIRFLEEEVWNMVSVMKRDKSLGSDGFSISFYKKCWDIMKGDLLNVFDEFYYSEEFYEHLNNTFIVLIPKKNNAQNLREFHPISLLSNVYKIIAKTLSSRLKVVMKGIIV